MNKPTPTKRYEYMVAQVKDDGRLSLKALGDREYEEATLKMFNELGADGWCFVDRIAHEPHQYPRWLMMREIA
jgi:hypothetical protein